MNYEPLIPLGEPDFINRDIDKITADLIAKYEQLSGKTLHPAQPERLLINLIAYAKANTHIGIQDAAKQNMVRFARAPMLDYLGEWVTTDRLAQSFATTTARFTLANTQTVPVVIPVGTEIASSDAKISFSTDSEIIIAVGSLSAEVSATCATAGVAGNDWQIGQVNQIASDLGDVEISVSNITISKGGADVEETERYRQRLLEAPEKFSVAGPEGAYRFWAMSAHQNILDVGIVAPMLRYDGTGWVSDNDVPPGEVRVYVLLAGGQSDSEILDLVRSVLLLNNVRPLTDFVTVAPAEPINYEITAELTLYRGADSTLALQASRTACQKHVEYLAGGLGRDVVEREFSKLMKAQGIYDLTIPSLPANIVIKPYQWARCTGINITITGTAEG